MSGNRRVDGAVTWWQCVYGKLVEEPGGPIRPGEEHSRNGLSDGTPEGLMEQLRPARIGIGGGQSFPWYDYPWNDRGGIVVVPACADGAHYVVAGRVRARPERGEGQPGRRYFQSAYLIAPAEDWHPASLADLDGVLVADPLTEYDRALDRVETEGDALTEPLPPGWLDEILPPLRAAMSGRPIAIGEGDEPIGPLLDSLCRCLCALPRALAWRLPVGAHLARVTPEIAIGQGQENRLPLAIRDGEVVGEADLDLSLGEHYVRWLADLVGDCENLGQVRVAIDRDLEEFAAYDALGLDTPWEEVALRISRTLKEYADLVKLQDWLEADQGERPQLDFEILRTEALERIVTTAIHGSDRGLQLLESATDPEWTSAWNDAVSRWDVWDPRLALAALVGNYEPLLPEHAKQCRGLELPSALGKRAAELLLEVLRCQPLTGELEGTWLELASQGSAADPRWLRAWQTLADAHLFWHRAHLARTRGDADKLLGASGRAVTIARKLARGETVHDDHITPLAEAAPDGASGRDDRDHVLDQIHRGFEPAPKDGEQPRRFLGQLILAEALDHLGKDTRWSTAFADPRRIKQDDLRKASKRLISELAGSDQALTPALARLLMTAWPQLDAKQKTELERSLGLRVGQPAAWLMWGNEAAVPANRADLADESEWAMSSLLTDDPEALSRLVAGLLEEAQPPAGVTRGRLAELLVENAGVAGPLELLHPAIQAIGAVWRGTNPSGGPLSAEQWPTVLAVVRHHPKPPDLGPLLDLAEWDVQRRELLAALPKGAVATPSPAVLVAIMRGAAGSRDTSVAWSEILAGRNLDDQSGWRLLPALRGSWRSGGPLTPVETQVLKSLDGGSLAALAVAGVPLARVQFEKIGFEALTDGDFDYVGIATLTHHAQEAEASRLAYQISRWAIDAWKAERKSSLPKAEVERLRAGKSGWGRAVSWLGAKVGGGGGIEPTARAILEVSLEMLSDTQFKQILRTHCDD